MAVKGGFTFWRTYWDVAQDLTPAQQGEFYKAIADYMFADVDDEAHLTKMVRFCFRAIKPNLKTSRKQSANRIKNNPDWNQDETKSKPNQNQTRTKTEQCQYQYKDKGKCQYQDSSGGIPKEVRGQLVSLGMLREVQ